MKIKLERVSEDKKDTLYRLLEYSLFEESLTDGNEMNDDAIFEYKYFDTYFTDSNRDAFFIREKKSNKLQAAFMCLDLYEGNWEITPSKGNEIAYKFWKNVVEEYTKENYKLKDRTFIFKNEEKKSLSLYIPKIEDYWYEEKLQSDAKTMSYNAGYDVSYYGYHYETGCIDFPKERWKETEKKRQSKKRFFAYLKDEISNEFVGYVNYQYNEKNNRYECGILIEASKRKQGYAHQGLKLLCNYAKAQGIKSLYDNFETDRENTLKVFESMGFKVIKKTTWKKFDKEVEGVIVKIDL